MYRMIRWLAFVAFAIFFFLHFEGGRAIHSVAQRWENQVESLGTAHAAESVPAGNATVTVAFSPGNAEQTVVRAIQGAHKSIRVAAYSFTSRPIATALLDARERGVDVQIVADKSQRKAKYTSVRFLANKGVPVRIDSRYAIMHNKFLVIDNRTVETGSFNYTRSASLRNAENVIVLSGSPKIAATYNQEWERLWNESDTL